MRLISRALGLLLICILTAACRMPAAGLADTLPAPAPSKADAPAGSAVVAVSKHARVSVLTTDGWLKPQVPETFTAASDCLVASSHVGLSAGLASIQCGAATITSPTGQVWSDASPENAGRLVNGPNGSAAIVTADRVSILQGGKLQANYTPGGALGLSVFPTGAATYAANGTLWLAGPVGTFGGQLVSFDGRQWEHFGGSQSLISALKTPSDLRILAAAKDGGLWAATKNELYHFSEGKFSLVVDQSKFALEFKTGMFSGDISDMLVAANGDVWLASSEGIYTWNGKNLTLFDRGDGLPAKDVRGLASDTRGRIWAATAYGLAVYGGGRWQVVLPATSGLTDSDLVAVAVHGAPDIPAASVPPKTTTITGRLVHASGQPLADAEVILCDEGPGANHRHGEPLPCAEQLYTRTVRTDASGTYKFQEVPIGAYTIAANDKGTWYFAIRPPARDWQPIVALTPGQAAHLDMAVP